MSFIGRLTAKLWLSSDRPGCDYTVAVLDLSGQSTAALARSDFSASSKTGAVSEIIS